ncbi:MAG: hypothetical protein ACXWV0_06330, partial [Flavisolibacter sp.]
MKKILVFISCMVSAISVWGQKENFDLISFTPPQGWKKEVRETLVIYTSIDQVKRTWCQVAVVKSTISKGSVEQDFDSEWQELIIKNYNPPAAPQVNEVVESDGFKIKSGSAGFTFNNSDAYAILTSFSGHQRCASIVVTSNSQDFLVDVEAFLASVELTIPKVISNVPKEQPGVPVNDGFTFTTTNFDNGWTSTVQADWVQAVKGNIQALIHYPNKVVDEYNPDLLGGLRNAWNILVAPKYQSVTNLEFKPVSGWEPVELVEADAVEASSGRSVHLVLFKKNYYGGTGKYIEFITPDKKTFEQEFGVLNDATDWNILAGVATYNKFAVAEADLKGKWTSNFTGMLQ